MGFIYCLSALDKLVHDLVIHEMVEIFAGRRTPTPKYLSESISIDNHRALAQATLPPAELVFEGIVRGKLRHLSFMDPEKLVGALSLVWLENHKWQEVANDMGRDHAGVVTELKNLHARRNAIVHETDRDPNTGSKMPITPNDVERAELFVSALGESLCKLVLR
ncbi:MAG: hypothetical protein AB7P42_18320 [Gammaproteobacteria bacterium]